jgi:hypothetical protein
MKEPAPKRKWFIFAYPLAYLGSWTVMIGRWLIHRIRDGSAGMPGREDLGNILVAATVFTAWGFLYFPMGILGVFVWSSRFFESPMCAVAAAILGWVAYLTVIILGIRRPSWRLLWIFAGLAALNIAGCQCDHTVAAFRWSP